MKSDQNPILVTGIRGGHGATGAAVARALAARGIPVRALVRGEGTRVEPLPPGVEVAYGDLLDRRSLVPALQGVRAAYFAYPIANGIVEAAATFASAARATGLERIVVMSMAPAHPDSPSHLARAQWLAEELFTAQGLPCLALRIAAFFLENIELMHRDDILSDGVIRNSFADIPVSWIRGADAGRLAAIALIEPEKLGRESAVYPTGGERMSHAELAQHIERKLGRPVRHETISREAWHARLLRLGERNKHVNPGMAAHIATLAERVRQVFPLNSTFEDAVGEKPKTIAEWVEHEMDLG